MRFEWKFAIGAIVAEFHDLFVVVGVYSLIGREVTTGTIAAVLTILGYSLYDTVIVFDRIRENAPRMTRVRYGDMVNRSIWETLTRSINTTLMTLLPGRRTGAVRRHDARRLRLAAARRRASRAPTRRSSSPAPSLTMLKEREPQHRKMIARSTEARG